MKMHEDSDGALEKNLVEAEFRAALLKLQEKIVRGEPARISYSAVAREANRSRTLIGYVGCPYPEVRDLITQAICNQKGLDTPTLCLQTSPAKVSQYQSGGGATVEIEQDGPFPVLRQLKDRVAELMKQNKAAAVKIVTIDDENQQLREEVKRLRTELARRKASAPNPAV